MLQRLRHDWPLLLLALPVVAHLAVFHYWPTAWNIIAFMDYSPYRPFWENRSSVSPGSDDSSTTPISHQRS